MHNKSFTKLIFFDILTLVVPYTTSKYNHSIIVDYFSKSLLLLAWNSYYCDTSADATLVSWSKVSHTYGLLMISTNRFNINFNYFLLRNSILYVTLSITRYSYSEIFFWTLFQSVWKLCPFLSDCLDGNCSYYIDFRKFSYWFLKYSKISSFWLVL